MGNATPANSPFAATTPRLRPQDPPRFEASTLVAGRYRLDRFLARGGMAEVWLATHESLKCEVAIKFIDQRLAFEHTGALERFRMEAQVSARLGTRSKHVVAVQDAGEHDGRPYLVMEFVPGRTLEHEIESRGPLDPARLADLLDQTADALTAAHALGIVHRDLKPSNLMLIDEPGGGVTLKVSDFGIAKALTSDLRIDRPKETSAGELVGSPAYMSPEQVDGRRDLDARSDLWSLAAVCYEALTGRTCFESRSISDLLITISLARYTPPSRVRPDLPKALDGWFSRALAVAPEDRFASAAEMAEAFRAAITNKHVPRRPVWLAAAGALLLAVGVTVAISASRSSATEARPSPTASATITAPSNDIAPTPPLPVEPVAPSIEVSPSATIAPTPEPSAKASSARPKPSASASVSAPAASASTKKPPVKKEIDKSEIQ